MMRGKQFPGGTGHDTAGTVSGSCHEGKSFEEIIDISLNEIEMIEANGFDGYIIQNRNDAPCQTACASGDYGLAI